MKSVEVDHWDVFKGNDQVANASVSLNLVEVHHLHQHARSLLGHFPKQNHHNIQITKELSLAGMKRNERSKGCSDSGE